MGRQKKYGENMVRVAVIVSHSKWEKLYGARLSEKYGRKKMQDVINEAIDEWFVKRDGPDTLA